MSAYVFLLLFLFGLLLLDLFIKINGCSKLKSRKSILATLIFIVLFLIGALRDSSVGIDMFAYSIHFDNIAKANWCDIFSVSRLEPGYILYNKLISSYISNDFRALVVISSGIVAASFTFFLSKNSPYLVLSIIIFVCFGFFSDSFNLIRQYLAMSICLLGLNSLINKKSYKSFFIYSLVAITFHYTAVVYMPILYLFSFNFNKKFVAITFIIAINIALFSRYIIQYLVNNYYTAYVDKIVIGEGVSLLIFQVLLLLSSFLCIRYKKINQNRLLILVFQMSSIACVFQLLSIQFSLFNRVVLYYFSVSILLLIPFTVRMLGDKKVAVILAIGYLLVLLIFFFFIYLKRDPSGILNYKLIL